MEECRGWGTLVRRGIFKNLFLKTLIKWDFRKERKLKTLYNEGGRRMKDHLLFV
jgi:hypothetical protein